MTTEAIEAQASQAMTALMQGVRELKPEAGVFLNYEMKSYSTSQEKVSGVWVASAVWNDCNAAESAMNATPEGAQANLLKLITKDPVRCRICGGRMDGHCKHSHETEPAPARLAAS